MLDLMFISLTIVFFCSRWLTYAGVTSSSEGEGVMTLEAVLGLAISALLLVSVHVRVAAPGEVLR